jgi:hypothetical protein
MYVLYVRTHQRDVCVSPCYVLNILNIPNMTVDLVSLDVISVEPVAVHYHNIDQ